MLTKPIREQNTLIQQNSHANSKNNHAASSSLSSAFESSSSNSLAMHKQAFYSIAKSIAVLTVNNQVEGQLVIEQFIADIKDPKSSDSMRLLALLCLGETGKYMLDSFSLFCDID